MKNFRPVGQTKDCRLHEVGQMYNYVQSNLIQISLIHLWCGWHAVCANVHIPHVGLRIYRFKYSQAFHGPNYECIGLVEEPDQTELDWNMRKCW